MQLTRVLTGLFLGMAILLPSSAQQPRSSKMRIEVGEARVYSGAGFNTLLTGVLKKGATVEVLQQRDDGWLEIEPPHGSFSWINDRFVKRLGGGLQVTSRSPVPLRVGSVISPDRPTNVITGPVQYGTQFVALRPEPVQAEDGRWWPVTSNKSERRYIHQDTVRPLPALAERGPEKGAGAVARPPIIPDPDNSPPSPERTRSLWQQAQEAERTGNLGDAIRLYDELARVSTEDPLRLLALNRAQFLRDGQRVSPRSPPVRPEPARQPPLPTAPVRPAVQPRTVPEQSVAPAYPVGTAPPTGMGATGQVPGGPIRMVGRLEATKFRVDGRRTYALVTSQGMLRMYVSEEEGVNLETYVNRNIEVTGPTVYRGDLRTNWMRVTQVTPLQ